MLESKWQKGDLDQGALNSQVSLLPPTTRFVPDSVGSIMYKFSGLETGVSQAKEATTTYLKLSFWENAVSLQQKHNLEGKQLDHSSQ